MGVRIFGLGAGVVILLFLWSITIILFTACVKVGRILSGVATVGLAALISTLLLVWPNASSSGATGGQSIEVRLVDNVLLARVVLILALCAVLLVSTVRFFRHHLAQPPPSIPIAIPDRHHLKQDMHFSYQT